MSDTTLCVAKITRIDEGKKGGYYGQNFVRIYFQRVPGKEWAKTDLVAEFRNFARWKNLLKVGNVLTDLRLKNSNTIDADSFPKFLRYELPEVRPKKPAQLKFSFFNKVSHAD